MGFGQFAATSQFFLFGKKHCTQTGYEKHRKEYAEPEFLEQRDLARDKVSMATLQFPTRLFAWLCPWCAD